MDQEKWKEDERKFRRDVYWSNMLMAVMVVIAFGVFLVGILVEVK